MSIELEPKSIALVAVDGYDRVWGCARFYEVHRYNEATDQTEIVWHPRALAGCDFGSMESNPTAGLESLPIGKSFGINHNHVARPVWREDK